MKYSVNHEKKVQYFMVDGLVHTKGRLITAAVNNLPNNTPNKNFSAGKGRLRCKSAIFPTGGLSSWNLKS